MTTVGHEFPIQFVWFTTAIRNLSAKQLTLLSSVFCHPTSDVVEVNGIEPMTSCVQGRRSPS